MATRSLQLEEVELLRHVWIHRVGDGKGPRRIKQIRRDATPVGQWQRDVGGTQDVIGSVRNAAGAAEDDVAARYRNAFDLRLRRKGIRNLQCGTQLPEWQRPSSKAGAYQGTWPRIWPVCAALARTRVAPGAAAFFGWQGRRAAASPSASSGQNRYFIAIADRPPDRTVIAICRSWIGEGEPNLPHGRGPRPFRPFPGRRFQRSTRIHHLRR